MFISREGIESFSELRDLKIDEKWFPVPEAFTYETSDNEKAHALFYSPTIPTIKLAKQNTRRS